jgi:hypothetical protein
LAEYGTGAPLAAGLVDHLLEQEKRPLRPLKREHRPQRLAPLLGLERVYVTRFCHRSSSLRINRLSRLAKRSLFGRGPDPLAQDTTFT